MKNIRIFLSENFHFLVVKFSVYLNRSVFVMLSVALILSVWYMCDFRRKLHTLPLGIIGKLYSVTVALGSSLDMSIVTNRAFSQN